MRIVGSHRYFLNPSEKKTLDLMARNRTNGGEASDGDSSSAASLEEISADDFINQDARVSRSSQNQWMEDIMRYSTSRNVASNIYSFAWAQAVQNKPLGFDVKPEACDDDVEEVIEELGEGLEKEEGELEEGEIELGSELVSDERNDLSSNEVKIEDESDDMEVIERDSEEIGDFDRRVGVILEELETITIEEAESSFEDVCSRLLKSFASLKQMFSESDVPVLDALVQQAFMGIQTVYAVFKTGNLKKREQNGELLLRLLIHIKNQYSSFLTPGQVNEIDVRVQSLASEVVSKGKPSVQAESGGNVERPGISSPGLVALEKPNLVSRAVGPVGSNSGKAALPKLELPINSKSRVDFSPLLDLHADHDEGSLPSPTRDNARPFPIPKPIGFGMASVTTPQSITTPKNMEAEDGTLHPYVTDALKAVSSYQQKYGRNSLLTSNRLPSPTPSEDGDDAEDSHGEVSSSSVVSNARSMSTSSPFLPVGSRSSSGTPIESSSGPHLASIKNVGQLGPNPAVKGPSKSRDPRLRFLNSEAAPNIKRGQMTAEHNTPKNGLAGGVVNPRKHKAADEPVVDDHTLKRQRNGAVCSREAQVASGRGGWIEDIGSVASQTYSKVGSNDNMGVGVRKPTIGEVGPNSNGANKRSELIPSSSTAPTVSLPSLLKDVVVNPTMLMQLIKMEQQKLAAETQQKTSDPAASGLPVAVSLVNAAPTKSLEAGQNPAGKPQMPPQTTSMNDGGRIRMKPRDPRRILHTNLVHKTENSGSEPAKSSGTLSSDTENGKDRITVREQGEQAQTATLPSQPATLPDIAKQFTKNLKNLADIVSSSQSTSATPAASQNISQAIPSKVNRDSSEPKNFSGLSSQSCTAAVASQPANPWGDVDHLLDGYDDQQKAAIQKERARRIAEQNKMFAARKLCLVLDLDHTLLNSAKFVEVDPAHEEILRKKEEQDREKSQRHLFRFQHMGMWTKLRPGIWNFLEKASKLYELHLYTMGNKLYATEMAKVLDPTGALFAGRVISRGDDGDVIDGDERVPKSKDLDGVLGMESAVVIIDDSLRVWPLNKLNLIVVERYTYFPCSRRQFGLIGPSLLEIDHDERPEDGTLASSLSVIERIHQNFFSHRALNEVDVRNILAAEQRKILGGCKIVFSRVFPVGEANPQLHPLWQTAEQFGAVCTNQIDEQVTHVVANSLGTDKVNWALSTGRFVVHPGWVEASALLYRRASELDFVVKL